MNECTKCGKTIKANDRFCTACGTNVPGARSDSTREKKARVLEQKRNWQRPLIIAALVVAVTGGLWFGKGMIMSMKMGGRPQFAPLRDASARTARAVTVRSEGGVVHIPLSAVSDRNAHFFALESGGRTITFFVVRAADGSIRTAFDACMACNHAKLGYRQEGGNVVCNNCGMGFDPKDVGLQKGGCNPIPLEKTIDGQMIVLKAKDLEDGAQYF